MPRRRWRRRGGSLRLRRQQAEEAARLAMEEASRLAAGDLGKLREYAEEDLRYDEIDRSLEQARRAAEEEVERIKAEQMMARRRATEDSYNPGSLNNLRSGAQEQADRAIRVTPQTDAEIRRLKEEMAEAARQADLYEGRASQASYEAQEMESSAAQGGWPDLMPPYDQQQQAPQPQANDRKLTDYFSISDETPMPGREKEYEEFKELAEQTAQADAQAAQAQQQAQAAAQAAASGQHPSYGGAHAPPQQQQPPPRIDEERRNRSPGLQHNFYDTSTSDFKRPYGSGPAPQQAPMPAQQGQMPPPPQMQQQAPAPAAGIQGLYSVSDETPMPGREKEYEAFKQMSEAQEANLRAAPPPGQRPQGAQPSHSEFLPPTPNDFKPPPIDAERRNRSPGLQHNFYDLSTADFKRPHGMPRGAAPPEPQAPQDQYNTPQYDHTLPQNAPTQQAASGGGGGGARSSVFDWRGDANARP